MSGLTPGKRTLEHWRVGLRHRVREAGRQRYGMCTSVTPWGAGRIRWVRLALDDGSEASFAPSALEVVR